MVNDDGPNCRKQEYHWTTFHSGSMAGAAKHSRVGGNSTDDSTKTELKTEIQTQLTRGCGAGGVRWRNTGEGTEWKNTGNGDGDAEMLCRCGGKSDWGGAQENRMETEH